MLCILETGARGGQEASDGNRTHSFRILMRCGADYSDARVRHIHTHARGHLHIYTTSTFVIPVMTCSRLHLPLIYFDTKSIVVM